MQKIDINKLLTDIYGSIESDLRLTKLTINNIIQHIQDLEQLDSKTANKLANLLQPLISREKALYDYLNTKRKLLIEFLEKLQSINAEDNTIKEFIDKFEVLDIYTKNNGQIDIKEFMKERVPDIFNMENDEGLTD